MTMSKELWIAEMERRMAELIDRGVPDGLAYDIASNEAHGLLSDRLAEMADMARLRAKEGR